MYEICLDHSTHPVLATTPTLSQAFEAIEAIESLTATQLARNAEGASDLWLHLTVRHDSQTIARSATRIEPEHGAQLPG